MAGPLLEAIEQNQRCVLLIDEIDKVDYAFDARTDANFVIMARTDALANEGFVQLSTARLHTWRLARI